MDLIPVIFHEKQEGQLCAQHALNALLQGPYFTAVDLAEIARNLDAAEQQAMAEGGVDSDAYQKFMKEGSSNYDDSGFFSVQVISKALEVWNLQITSINSPDAAEAKMNPTEQDAFICNLQEHWFTLRRFGGSPKRWYNLNSLSSSPSYVSETYLSLLLAQLQTEGYSIFVVSNALPQSQADTYAAAVPVPPPSEIPKLTSTKSNSSSFSGEGNRLGGPVDDDIPEDQQLARALAMSLGQDEGFGEEDDPDMARALKQSLDEGGLDQKTLKKALEDSAREDEMREMEAAILASLREAEAAGGSPSGSGSGSGGASGSASGSGTATGADDGGGSSSGRKRSGSEAADAGSSSGPSAGGDEMSPEEIRRRRLARFGG